MHLVSEGDLVNWDSKLKILSSDEEFGEVS